MKWQYARRGIIEGEIARDFGDDWVDIELSNKVRMGYGDPMLGTGFRALYAVLGHVIRTRKSLLAEIATCPCGAQVPIDEAIEMDDGAQYCATCHDFLICSRMVLQNANKNPKPNPPPPQ